MSNVTDGFVRKEEWKREGKDFCVVVSRHTARSTDENDNNRWCVYLYVYPRHPSFDLFNPLSDMWSQPHFTCHSYVSFFKVHRDERGDVGSFQLGWDYNHDGDNFGWCSTADDASSVFWDANRLFEQAEQWATEADWVSQ